MQAADVVLRFLESIGKGAEAEFYLRLFQSERKESFAVIAVDGLIMRTAAAAVEFDLQYLVSLGLVPTIVFGHVAAETAAAHAEELRARLERAGVAGRIVAREEPVQGVRDATRAGVLPIVALPPGAPVPSRFAAVGDLAFQLGVRKLIFLTRRGALRSRGERRSLVNLATDAEGLLTPGALPAKQAALLEQARRILDRAPHHMTIAVTSPLALLRELFTVKGAGTLIRRGSTVVRRAGYGDVDIAGLRELLASSFAREPSPALFERSVDRIFLVEAPAGEGPMYRGVAIVKQTPVGAYLSKFAVERQAQGEGIGRDVWRELVTDYPALFWRSRPDNPVTPFYVEQCDGLSRHERWTVYWRGVPSRDLPLVIEQALGQPVDFPAP